MITQDNWHALLATAESKIAEYLQRKNYNHPLLEFWQAICFEATHGSVPLEPYKDRYYLNSNINRYVYHCPIRGTIPKSLI